MTAAGQRAIRDGIARQGGGYEEVTEKGRQYFSAYMQLTGAKLVHPLRPEITAVTGIRYTDDEAKQYKTAEAIFEAHDGVTRLDQVMEPQACGRERSW